VRRRSPTGGVTHADPRAGRRRLRLGGLACTLILSAACDSAQDPEEARSGPAQPDPAEWTAATPVTDPILRGGHAANPTLWPTYGGDWAQTRYSPLSEIHLGNVARLRPAWIHQTGVLGTYSTTPVVLGSEMYVTTPAEQGRQELTRLDSTIGEVVWTVEIPGRTVERGEAIGDLHLPPNFGPNRGVAVYGDRVYMGTLNGTLLAVDRATGETVFEVETLSPRLTGAPLAARGLIMLGLSWVDRGAVQAFDAETGAHVWTWRSIPTPEEGGWWGEWVETLPGRDDISLGRDIAQERADSTRLAEGWMTGGGSAPMTPTFDEELGLLFVATGGPDPTAFPPPSEPHPGDMRWTNSVCALRVESGEVAWCHQFLPHDIWGASGPTPPILFELEIQGETVPALGRFSGMGILHVWDRRDGTLLRVSDNYIPVGDAGGPGSGPNLIRGGMAGTVWSPGSYSPETGLFYSSNQHIPGYFEPRDVERAEGEFGNVAAVDPVTGEVAWTHRTERPLAGGTIVTAGGLVFAGRSSGWFDAYDAVSGERVWSFRTGAGCNAAPSTYRAGGVQHVVIACGGHGNLDPRGGNALIAFALTPG
jgi:alcohol dehydrogenase (cytochrome c)